MSEEGVFTSENVFLSASGLFFINLKRKHDRREIQHLYFVRKLC